MARETQDGGNQGVIMYGGTIHGENIAQGAHATATQTRIGGPDPAESLKVDDLRTALKGLHAALRQANLDDDTQITAMTAAGVALKEGIKDDKVKPEVVTENVRKIGEALHETNVTVAEGTELWQSVARLATVLAPVVVGGAHVVGAWFGIPL